MHLDDIIVGDVIMATARNWKSTTFSKALWKIFFLQSNHLLNLSPKISPLLPPPPKCSFVGNIQIMELNVYTECKENSHCFE